MVIVIDLLYHGLHGHPGAGILTGKEDTEAGADDQRNQTDHNDDNHGYPAACSNGGNQCFYSGDNGFHCCNCCFRHGLGSYNRCLCRRPCSLRRSSGGFRRCLCGFLCRFRYGLCSLDGGFCRLFCGLYGFLCCFYRTLCRLDRCLAGRFGGLLYGLFSTLHSFDRLIRRIRYTLPGTLCGLFLHLLFGLLLCLLFCRLFGRFRFGWGLFLLLNIVPCLGDIFLGGFQTFTPLLVKLVDSFIGYSFGSTCHAVSGIFIRVAFRRIYAMLRLVLGTHIGFFHALPGNRRFVYSFNGALDNIPCFNISHQTPPPQREAGSASPQ